ncbi:hypothetical protein ACLMJK_001028 [Lecanora helva]
MSSSSPIIPASFQTRKRDILSSLSAPSDSYTDLSPKGSVDSAIKELIDRINALEGIVTTSSCSGRISVFLEGKKRKEWKDGYGVDRKVAVPGGKGLGGRWLFVSHEPVNLEESSSRCKSEILGLKPMQGTRAASVINKEPCDLRVAKLQFEPMILHIMAASLHHAQSILTAAINSGFRESGVQSLKNLDDPDAFPMIAVRSAGLALESVVGVCTNDDEEDCKPGTIKPQDEESVSSIVGEEYLELLLKLANERFKTNTQRMKRFEKEVFRKAAYYETKWEDGEARKERKRAEGLSKQSQLRNKESLRTDNNTGRSHDNEDGGLEGDLIFNPPSIS